MEGFYERFSKLALQSSKSINQIERELGYPRNALHGYKFTKNPSGMRVAQTANYFGVTPQYLLGLTSFENVYCVRKTLEDLNFEEKLQMYNYCQAWLVPQVSCERSEDSKKY